MSIPRPWPTYTNYMPKWRRRSDLPTEGKLQKGRDLPSKGAIMLSMMHWHEKVGGWLRTKRSAQAMNHFSKLWLYFHAFSAVLVMKVGVVFRFGHCLHCLGHHCHLLYSE